MKKKTLFLLSILTVSATLLSGCKASDSVDGLETIETTPVESEATEEAELISRENSTEQVESTEETESAENNTTEKETESKEEPTEETTEICCGQAFL